MFTGIITEIGTVQKRTARGLEITASPRVARRLGVGESIAVNGACLSVISVRGRIIKADVMEETWQKTMLGKLESGEKINLELPLSAGSLISGHFVQGHVDGIARVRAFKKTNESYIISLEVPNEISRYLVGKGSIAINGVSLTIIEAKKNKFSVGIIPHTWKSTTLSEIKIGDNANIEVDILAKYVEKLNSLPASLPADLPAGSQEPAAQAGGGSAFGGKSKKSIRIGIIGTSFRREVTKELEKRCITTLKKNGISSGNIKVVRVPGAFEVPLAAKIMAASGKYDCLVALGSIVKGKTYHFEQIANECARGCAEVSRAYEIPVVFEVLAVYDIADALERATRKNENKGIEAAETALEMIKLMSRI